MGTHRAPRMCVGCQSRPLLGPCDAGSSESRRKVHPTVSSPLQEPWLSFRTSNLCSTPSYVPPDEHPVMHFQRAYTSNLLLSR